MANTYSYSFADQSGIVPDSTDPNPYNSLLEACHHDPTQISALYQKHRTTRASQQRDILTSPNFKCVTIDPTLRAILDEEARPANEKTGYLDPRRCAVLWGRPPKRIKGLIAECQQRLKEVIPNAYFQPLSNLHITVLELAHSLTPQALYSLLAAIPPSLIEAATDLPHNNAHLRYNSSESPAYARLSNPMITYDGSALALSFLPAIPYSKRSHSATRRPEYEDESYTYHHLRSDMWSLFNAQAVPIASRYVVPSAHMTIARFLSGEDTSTDGVCDASKMVGVVKKIEEINTWLGEEFSGENDPEGKGMWTVGEEEGLCFRVGTVWYGGGESLREGQTI